MEMAFHFRMCIFALTHWHPVTDFHVFILFIVGNQCIGQHQRFIGAMSEKHTAVVGNIPDCLFCCTQLAFVYFSPIIHFLHYLFFLEYVFVSLSAVFMLLSKIGKRTNF